MNHLKIGFVLDDGLDSTDGVQQYVLALGEWLRGQGHNVHYFVGQTERTDIVNVHSLSRNLTTRFNGNRLTTPLPASIRKIKNILMREQFDVLHVQVPYSPLMAARVIRCADKKTAIIGTFHVLPHSDFVVAATRALGLWLKPSLKGFDKMLAVSPAAQSYAAKVFKVDSTVLPNVVDYQRFNKAKPFKKYNDGKINIIFLGRLVPRKGCAALLQAVALLANLGEKLPEFRVIVCGKGSLQDELEQYVTSNGLGDIVEFVGFVNEADKPRFYASADIAVFPSSGGESFGIVLIEAMASGRSAVLAGDNPGYRSVMAPQEKLLFPPLDTAVLAAKLEHYIKSKTSRQEMAEWGAKYTEQFEISTVGKNLLQIYANALRKKQ